MQIEKFGFWGELDGSGWDVFVWWTDLGVVVYILVNSCMRLYAVVWKDIFIIIHMHICSYVKMRKYSNDLSPMSSKNT